MHFADEKSAAFDLLRPVLGSEFNRKSANSNSPSRVWIWEWTPVARQLSIPDELRSDLRLGYCLSFNNIKEWNAVVHPDDRDSVVQSRNAILDEPSGSAYSYEFTLSLTSKTPIWCRELITHVLNGQNLSVLRGFIQNIDPERQHKDFLLSLSLVDHLTGLGNRRAWDQSIRTWLEMSKRKMRVSSIAIIDIDRFKLVNDTYGHQCGDRILVLVGDVLRSQVRLSDSVFRIGGDEFAIVFPETSELDAAKVVTRIMATLAKRCAEAVELPTVTLSIGITQIYQSDLTPGDIIERADTALYASKNSGRARLTVARNHHVAAMQI